MCRNGAVNAFKPRVDLKSDIEVLKEIAGREAAKRQGTVK